MTGYLTYEANQARIDDMHRRAAEVRRAGRATARKVPRSEARAALRRVIREGRSARPAHSADPA